MKKKYIAFFTIILLLSFSSCKKFLQESSQSLTYVSSLSDLSELLVGSGYLTTDYHWIQTMDDDTEEFIGGSAPNSPLTSIEGFHLWQANPWVTMNNNLVTGIQIDQAWSGLYKHIAVVNSVVVDADRFKNQDTVMYKKVKGECYFLRAAYYFTLVNIYAKPYSATTAATDPGVPLKLTNYIEDNKLYTRASVAAIYDQVISDLKISISYLTGVVQPSNYRANEVAARALLGRVYLYMGQWQQAYDKSNDVITNGGYSLINLNTYSPYSSYTYATSTESIFTMGLDNSPNITSFSYNTLQVSQDLQNSFSVNDLRPLSFFTESMSYETNQAYNIDNKLHYPENSSTPVGSEFTIRLSEIYLNKAEALAMLGKFSDAAQVLDAIRQLRIKPYTVGLITAKGQELIDLIRAERRRELCFEGHRWFDLRRYAVNPTYPLSKELIHYQYVFNSTKRSVSKLGFYKLGAYATENGGGWVIPIPDYEMTYNGAGMIQNDRPVRMLN